MKANNVSDRNDQSPNLNRGRDFGLLAKNSLCLLALFAAVGCSQDNAGSIKASNDSTGIINGDAITREDSLAKSVVLLKMASAGNMGKCTGTLIREDVVLTASHCVDLAGDEVAVQATLAANASQPCATSMATTAVNHPEARRNRNGVHMPDVLILKLKNKLCGAVPATLSETAANKSEEVSVAGFGIGTKSQVLADSINIRIQNPTEEEFMGEFSDLVSQEPDADPQLRDAFKQNSRFYTFALPVQKPQSLCSGDSGGPVYRHAVGGDLSSPVQLMGVNGAILGHPTKGNSECHNAYFQLYTPIAKIVPWINETIAQLN